MIWEILLLVAFCGAGLALAQTYFLYPLFLLVLAGGETGQEITLPRELPSVALIVATYNEADVIEAKIQNCLELDYPDELLNVVVFSDASDDGTDDIVREYEDRGVTLMRIEGRVGKTECQNRVASRVEEDVLVFSDANSMYEPDAIHELVRGFGPGVGCVVGELRYRDSSAVSTESVYWRYESRIKRLESRFNSLVTGNGSIYAVAADAYVPQPRDAISDFTEPLSVVRNGQTVQYAPSAVAWEETESTTGEELQRRVRIVTRSWNSVARYTDLLNPLQRPRFAYQLWSHKILRWLSPLLLTVVLVATLGLVALSGSAVYQMILAVQAAFYAVAAVGWVADRTGVTVPTAVAVPHYFLQANYGMARGLVNFLQGENIVVWETSSRAEE